MKATPLLIERRGTKYRPLTVDTPNPKRVTKVTMETDYDIKIQICNEATLLHYSQKKIFPK